MADPELHVVVDVVATATSTSTLGTGNAPKRVVEHIGNRGTSQRTMRPCLLLGLIVLHSACAHSASSAPPATVNKIAAQGTAAARDEQRSASDRARGLYEILMRLAQDPAAQAKLAPAARLIFHGEETTDEALTDVYGELRWVRESELPLVTDAESKSASEESFVHCAAAELQCVIVQPGGETTFRFVQIVEGGERRVVLSSIESAEP